MKTLFVADDGTTFSDAVKCSLYETKQADKGKKTSYARAIEKLKPGELAHGARTYAKWLREKQNYPATDSGEHCCCDLLEEMASRLAP